MTRKIEKILKKVIPKKIDFDILIPEKENFGHYATNVALRLAKIEKKNPLEIAAQIVQKIEKTAPRNFFEKIEIAAPGFINFWLSAETLGTGLKEVLKSGADYGKSDLLKKKKIMVEFTDPNPFKEFHVGHLYSNIIGETLCRLLEANGARIKRANYQGDVGLHVAKAVWGMREKMAREKISLAQLKNRALDSRIEFMAQSYVRGNRAYEEDTDGAKLDIVELNRKIFASDKEVRDLYESGRKWSLEYFERIYKRLGTKFDYYYFERDVGELGLRLVHKGLKRGIFEESEGAVVFPGEKYGLHRRVFVNSEGLPTYEAKELGLAFKKYEDFPYDISIVVTGSEVIDYFKVLIAALKKINLPLGNKIRHIAHGMVRLPQGKMASRTGEIVKAEDLLDEMKNRTLKIIKSSGRKITVSKPMEAAENIAVGAVKYSLLKTNPGSDVVFDINKSLSLEGDSGPYLQYTYARLKSILRKTKKIRKADTKFLAEEQELRLIRKIIEFPGILQKATTDYLPNHLAKYLYELAVLSNQFYESTPILKDKNIECRQARLVLIEEITLVLKNGLNILGIKVLEKI